MGVCFLWSWFRACAHISSAIFPTPVLFNYLPAGWLHVICSTALLPDHHLQMCVYLVGLFGGLGDLHINQNDSWKVKGAQGMFTIWAVITDLCPVIEKLVNYWSPRTSWRLGKASSFWKSLACPFTVIQVPAGGKWEVWPWLEVRSNPVLNFWAGKHLEDMRDHVGSWSSVCFSLQSKLIFLFLWKSLVFFFFWSNPNSLC